MKVFHTPVLLNEVLQFLNIKENGIYVDATCGEGGHSLAILNHLKNGLLICIDQDEEILNRAKERLSGFTNVRFYNDTFDNLDEILKNEKLDSVDGILADLGISMFHLQGKEENVALLGLSYNDDKSPLDMRLDKRLSITAFDVVNRFKESELARILFEYGEEKEGRKIAREVVRSRPVKTAKQLADIVIKVKRERRKRIHPATKTFLALRIFVNEELEKLESFIPLSVDKLCKNGRFVIISYHSLEDRIVKNKFKLLEKECKGKVITKKVITPSQTEIRQNKSSRSAKMRVFEKSGG